MPTPNTIVLKGDLCHHEEYNAAAGLKPGHLLMVTSAGKVQKHNAAGRLTRKLFAKEDALQGLTTADAYVTDNPVMCHDAEPGDLILGRVPAAAVALVAGDRVMSNGDGTLVKALANGSTLYAAAAASAAVSNTVTETAFDKSYTIPANSLKAGDVVRVRAQGIATATNSTDTLNVKLKIGSTVVAATGAVDVANNDIFYIEADIVIRTLGASGTLVAAGTTSLGASGTVTAKAFYLASTTVDTTAAQALTVTATWSVASSSNSVRLDVLDITLIGGEVVPLAVVEEAVDNSAGVDEAFAKFRII